MPEYSISEKFKELVHALLQTFDTGGVKFLMDHDQQRDLSWQKEKDRKLCSDAEYAAPSFAVSPGAGSHMTRFPKQNAIQPAAAVLRA